MATKRFSPDTRHFQTSLETTPLSNWANRLVQILQHDSQHLKHGHLPAWTAALAALPARQAPCPFRVSDGSIRIQCDFLPSEARDAEAALKALSPWRKGPFHFDHLHVDAEWRSDWKWVRLASAIEPLCGRCVLDVGCGNGYYLWRMLEAGARLVIGIDPSLHYQHQFMAAQRYIQSDRVHCLPLGLEALPDNGPLFDTVFSMGVLYHRRDPHSHLCQLRQALNPGGQLVLETLVVGDDTASLQVNGRYANMKNVYELPSTTRLVQWLEQAGFRDPRVVSSDQTSTEEQRSTEWMTSWSLSEALDPKQTHLTIEGFPRPRRVIVTASP